MRLAVRHDGTVTLTAPVGMPVYFVERFLRIKGEWLLRKIEMFSHLPPTRTKHDRMVEYAQHKDTARVLAIARIAHFSELYGVRVNKISIRNQSSRWGSCSKKGNLSFNYRIALLPANLADYIIAHEVCHLKEFNHSRAFWSLVALSTPNHARARKELRTEFAIA